MNLICGSIFNGCNWFIGGELGMVGDWFWLGVLFGGGLGFVEYGVNDGSELLNGEVVDVC